MRQTGELLNPAHCLGLGLSALLWLPEAVSVLEAGTPTTCAGTPYQRAKWENPEALTDTKGLRNPLDFGVMFALLLHHGEDLPVPQNER